MKRLISLFLLLCMVASSMPALAANAFYGNMEVVNCNEWVSLREKPSTGAKRLVKVPLGAIVTDCRQEGDNWIYAVYEEWEGYIQATYLRPLEGFSVHTAMLVTNCDEGTAFYRAMGDLVPEGIIPADTLVRDCAVYEAGRAYVKYGDRGVYVDAECVVPYTEMLHFPQQITLHGNLYNGDDNDKSLALQIAYGNEFPILEYDYSVFEYDEYMEADAEDLPKVHFILYSEETLNHVHLFGISVRSWDDTTGDVIYDATLENIQYQVDPEHPLSVGAVIWGDTPNLAVGYQDWTGAYHFAFVEISGEDASLFLREF